MIIEATTLKIAGGILITGGVGLIGVFFSKKDAYRKEQLIEMKKALTMLKSEIRFSFSPFAEAAKSVSYRIIPPVSDIFAESAESAETDKSGDIGAIWKNAVYAVRDASHFNEKDIDAIASFGKSLGYLDRQMQENSIDLLIAYIDGETETLDKDAPARAKMYRSLGFLGGLLITVMLV